MYIYIYIACEINSETFELCAIPFCEQENETNAVARERERERML